VNAIYFEGLVGHLGSCLGQNTAREQAKDESPDKFMHISGKL
jgi:hypothetical protein